MQPDTGAISLLMLAAALSIGALVIGVLCVSERAPSHATSLAPRHAEPPPTEQIEPTRVHLFTINIITEYVGGTAFSRSQSTELSRQKRAPPPRPPSTRRWPRPEA